ncbi:MAG: hypothetical protein SVR94_04440, partial [Pseudomonadota bacterium]|nr:hypothetical protein [Pseudomonadota bacterium]
ETPLLQLNPLVDSMQQQLQHSLEMMELSLETQLDMADTALENQLNGFTALQESFKILEEQTRESSQIFHKEINILLNNIHSYSDRFYNKLLALEHSKFKTQTPLTLPTVLETATDTTEDWSEHCYSLMESAEYQQAVACFEKAIQLNPTDFSLYYNKACCHALQEQVELTVLTLQQAITLNAECLEMAQTDSDFDKVRYHANFQALLTHKPLSRGQSA